MSAAPEGVGRAATIIDSDMAPDGSMAVLREGSNGWTCFTDFAGTPFDDPMCMDSAWMAFFDAYMTGAEPQIDTIGVSYMLQGGGDASTTDPTLMAPPEGEGWILSGPHIMLVAPGGFDASVFSTDPNNGGPWIMFDGTPYEYLMVPTDSSPAAAVPLTFGRMVAEATAAVSGIAPLDAQARRESEPDLLVIDVRDSAQAAAGTVAGAVNIPLGTLIVAADHEMPANFQNPELADHARPIIVTCTSGPIGAVSAKVLHDMGFTNVRYLEGGVKAWKEAGLPMDGGQ